LDRAGAVVVGAGYSEGTSATSFSEAVEVASLITPSRAASAR
jgi:hypothetical protein